MVHNVHQVKVISTHIPRRRCRILVRHRPTHRGNFLEPVGTKSGVGTPKDNKATYAVIRRALEGVVGVAGANTVQVGPTEGEKGQRRSRTGTGAGQ